MRGIDQRHGGNGRALAGASSRLVGTWRTVDGSRSRSRSVAQDILTGVLLAFVPLYASGRLFPDDDLVRVVYELLSAWRSGPCVPEMWENSCQRNWRAVDRDLCQLSLQDV